ncbi:MDR family NADPH-dependent oxidoreductase [Rubritalea marina]|uniref:MDR family NADPH-dependent oxidoreductase n=1 Tax=Rubritalea marina TaxID=361055 RepID=UPI000380479A|nr:2-enoyl thioester reductase domain-containing protein [Rubritalea marina]
MISNTLQLHTFGQPEDVCHLEALEVPTLGQDDILVRMLATPINPADINFAQGTYGVKPELPATPGIEGCAEVLQSNNPKFAEGDKVIFIQRVGTWRSHLVCQEAQVLKIPKEIDYRQAAMLKVNPATAWQVLHQFKQVQPGDWVIQNAANSGVGQCLIQIANELGIHTINTVRREELIPDLEALGAKHVLLDDTELVSKVRGICGDAAPVLASNAVGGDSALRQMDALGEFGGQVTFGAMSMRSLKVPNKFLIFKGIQLYGLWITKWLGSAKRDEIAAVYQNLATMVLDGKLNQKIEKCYAPQDHFDALKRAQENQRDGKILIDWTIG